MQNTNLFLQALHAPWKAFNELARICILPFVRIQFWLNGIPWGKQWKIYGLPIIQKYRGSKITFGDGLELRSTTRSNPLAPFHPVVISTRSSQATISAGKNFRMTGGSLVAQKKIKIGNEVTVGANSTIIDTDFHPLKPSLRKKKFNAGRTAPVHVGSDVFIGTQTIILKGVKLARGSIVGAGTVVRATKGNK